MTGYMPGTPSIAYRAPGGKARNGGHAGRGGAPAGQMLSTRQTFRRFAAHFSTSSTIPGTHI